VSGFVLTWLGDKVRDTINEARQEALEEIAKACVDDVRAQRTGRLAEGVESRPVEVDGAKAGVQWGYFEAPRGDELFFELFIEAGTPYISGDNAKRNAADRHYGDLPRSIRRKTGL
jgi:hypothetical protein